MGFKDRQTVAPLVRQFISDPPKTRQRPQNISNQAGVTLIELLQLPEEATVASLDEMLAERRYRNQE